MLAQPTGKMPMLSPHIVASYNHSNRQTQNPRRPRYRKVLAMIGYCLSLIGITQVAQGEALPWAVYYSNKAPLSTLMQYQLLIFDNETHPPITPLIENNKIVLGYLSLGEVGQHRTYYHQLKRDGLLLQENENWPGSYAIDIRDKRWTSMVIETLLPSILQQGFHGIFIDTLDIPPHQESLAPKRFRGMKKAAIQLIETIRYHYPSIKIMLNRGYEILPQVAPIIDYALGESVYTTYNFTTESYEPVNSSLYTQQVNILNSAKKVAPHLVVMTLDYWQPNDVQGIANIYAQQRANGFVPYVGTIKLDIIVPEPKL